MHGCAIGKHGRVFCWGYNRSGELGPGAVTKQSERAIAVPLPEEALSITVGGAHSCALLRSGRIACWGDNMVGQLGNGVVSENEPFAPRPTPDPVFVVGVTDAVSIAAGGLFSCAATKSGRVLCWGRNVYGELGQTE